VRITDKTRGEITNNILDSLQGKFWGIPDDRLGDGGVKLTIDGHREMHLSDLQDSAVRK